MGIWQSNPFRNPGYSLATWRRALEADMATLAEIDACIAKDVFIPKGATYYYLADAILADPGLVARIVEPALVDELECFLFVDTDTWQVPLVWCEPGFFGRGKATMAALEKRYGQTLRTRAQAVAERKKVKANIARAKKKLAELGVDNVHRSG